MGVLAELRSLRKNDSIEKWSPAKMRRKIQMAMEWFSIPKSRRTLGTRGAQGDAPEVVVHGERSIAGIVRGLEIMKEGRIETRVIGETVVMSVGDVTGAETIGWMIMIGEDGTAGLETMSMMVTMRGGREGNIRSKFNFQGMMYTLNRNAIPQSQDQGLSKSKHVIESFKNAVHGRVILNIPTVSVTFVGKIAIVGHYLHRSGASRNPSVYSWPSKHCKRPAE